MLNNVLNVQECDARKVKYIVKPLAHNYYPNKTDFLKTLTQRFISTSKPFNNSTMKQFNNSASYLHFTKAFSNLTFQRQTYSCLLIRTDMKAQSEATIQFSGYPLNIVETKEKITKAALIVVKPSTEKQNSPLQKDFITNDPENWDSEWFGNYE